MTVDRTYLMQRLFGEKQFVMKSQLAFMSYMGKKFHLKKIPF